MKAVARNGLSRAVVIVLVVLLTTVAGAGADGPVTSSYGNLTLSPPNTATNWPHAWDLTQGDLTLSYTIDMNGVRQSAPYKTSYTEVGIRQVGAGNFDPGPRQYQGGAGGWMISLVGDLTVVPATQNLHDRHHLQASGGRDERDYDVTSAGTVTAPFGTGLNYGIWFDRDGVDPSQETLWGAVSGGTYNTGGIYNIVITYHAIDATLGIGTMFATVNGIQTGFYTGAWHNSPPDIYPAGLSFKGNMTRMQIFAGIEAGTDSHGDVVLSNINVTGFPATPRTKDECEKGGWQILRRADGSTFVNQGECVKYVNAGK